MWDSILSGIQGMGNKITGPMANAWDRFSAPSDDLIGALADAEGGGTDEEKAAAWKAVQESPDGWDKISSGLQALGQLSPRTKPEQMSHSFMGRSGGGTNIQTRDDYADSMKALIDKYGHLMFNKNF